MRGWTPDPSRPGRNSCKARSDQRRLEYRRKLGVVQDEQDTPAADVPQGETLAPPATEFPAPNAPMLI